MGHWTEDLFEEDPELLIDELRNRGRRAPGEVDEILELLAERFDASPGSVLDVACGVGHHVVAFAERGLAAEGFDVSERYVEVARGKVDEAGVDADVWVGDMREVEGTVGEYDLVTCLWNSFGYFDDATNRAILEGFASLLAPGGTLVMEVAFRDAILAEFDEDNVVDDGDRLVAEEWSYDPATGRYAVDRHLFDRADGGLEHRGSSTWDVRSYSPPEIEWLCRDVGFGTARTFGGFDGSSPSLESGRLVVVARTDPVGERADAG